MSAAARFRYTMVAGATAVVIGTGFTVAGLNQHADAHETVPSAASEPLVPASEPAPAADSTGAVLDDIVETPPPTPTVSRKPAAKPSATTKKATTPAKPRPKPTPTVARKKATAPPTGGSVVEQVLAHINAARADEGLGALTLDTRLSKASALHNQRMIDGCGLSHQCDGESGLGERFTAQDVDWSTAGENIGFGSSGSSNAEMVRAANGLTDSMLAEVPPNDGHRKNLLNKNFGRIGLSVVRDDKGVTWMTQDFVD